MDGGPASASSNEEVCSIPLYGFLIGIYPFYENWSTETFRKIQRSEVFCFTSKSPKKIIGKFEECGLKVTPQQLT